MKPQWMLGAVLSVACAALWWWQTPGEKLGRDEIDRCAAAIEQRAPMMPAEKAEFAARLRAWGASDDGRPVYMLNAMRFFESIRRVPGAESITLSPVASNAHYEDVVMPLLFGVGGYPIFAGETTRTSPSAGAPSNLADYDKAADHWDRVLVVRYPNRRAFFRLVCDPRYLNVAPYKLAALDVALVPTRAELVVPDIRYAAIAVSLIVFLAAGWFGAARRK